MAHNWSPVGMHPDEPAEELRRQAYRANLGRNIADVQGLLRKTSMWENELRIQHADTKPYTADLKEKMYDTLSRRQADDLIKEGIRNASRVAVKIRDIADIGCDDRFQVSKVAVDGAMREAIRFQKEYEMKKIDGTEANSGYAPISCGKRLRSYKLRWKISTPTPKEYHGLSITSRVVHAVPGAPPEAKKPNCQIKT